MKLIALALWTTALEKQEQENYGLAEEISRKHYTDALLLLTATPHRERRNHSGFKKFANALRGKL